MNRYFFHEARVQFEGSLRRQYSHTIVVRREVIEIHGKVTVVGRLTNVLFRVNADGTSVLLFPFCFRVGRSEAAGQRVGLEHLRVF